MAKNLPAFGLTLLAMAVMACEPEGGLMTPVSGGSPTSTKASASPAKSGDPNVKGRTETGGTSASPSPSPSPTPTPPIMSVVLSPARATLNLAAEDGINTAGFPTSVRLSVLLSFSNSTTSSSPAEVTWVASPAGVVSVAADGLVTAQAMGTVTITATSKADSTKLGTATILVERNGALDVSIE